MTLRHKRLVLITDAKYVLESLKKRILKGGAVTHYATFYAFSNANFSSPLPNPAKQAESLYKAFCLPMKNSLSFHLRLRDWRPLTDCLIKAEETMHSSPPCVKGFHFYLEEKFEYN